MIELMPRMEPIKMIGKDAHRRWTLLEDWSFFLSSKSLHIHIPKGFVFNGASVPRIFSNIFPSTGFLFLAALVHDYLYQYTFMWTVVDSKHIKYYVDKSLADSIFKEIANEIYPKWTKAAWIAKAALTMGGQSAWDTCRKADGTYVKPKPYKYWGNEEDGS